MHICEIKWQFKILSQIVFKKFKLTKSRVKLYGKKKDISISMFYLNSRANIF